MNSVLLIEFFGIFLVKFSYQLHHCIPKNVLIAASLFPPFCTNTERIVSPSICGNISFIICTSPSLICTGGGKFAIAGDMSFGSIPPFLISIFSRNSVNDITSFTSPAWPSRSESDSLYHLVTV